jgi:hypothetical protein
MPAQTPASGLKIAGSFLIRYGRFGGRFEKKPCENKAAFSTLNQQVPGSSPGAPTTKTI